MESDSLSGIPLHPALVYNPTGTFISRMVALRPESLLCTRCFGRTPVAAAIGRAPPSPEVARILLGLVLQCPESIASSCCEWYALIGACRRFHEYPELIMAIVRAHPPALGAVQESGESEGQLPFQIVAAANPITREFVEKETLELALAVVENALGRVYDVPKRGLYEASHLAMFRRHAWRTATAYLALDKRKIGTSGFEVAQAIRKLDSNRRMNLCRDLFCGHRRTRNLLSGTYVGPNERRSFRDEVVGECVAGLSQLNRRDRTKPSLAHQVSLLESVNDNLDGLFLHFRSVACGVLLGDGR
jgi:hypothetical protein